MQKCRQKETCKFDNILISQRNASPLCFDQLKYSIGSIETFISFLLPVNYKYGSISFPNINSFVFDWLSIINGIMLSNRTFSTPIGMALFNSNFVRE